MVFATGCSLQPTDTTNNKQFLFPTFVPSSGPDLSKYNADIEMLLADCIENKKYEESECKDIFSDLNAIRKSVMVTMYLGSNPHDDPDGDGFENWIEAIANTNPFVNAITIADVEQQDCYNYFAIDQCSLSPCYVNDFIQQNIGNPDPLAGKKAYDKCIAECAKTVPGVEPQCRREFFEGDVTKLEGIQFVVDEFASKGFTSLDECFSFSLNTDTVDKLGCSEFAKTLKQTGYAIAENIPLIGTVAQILHTGEAYKSVTNTETVLLELSGGIPTTITGQTDLYTYTFLSLEKWQRIIQALQKKQYLPKDFSFQDKDLLFMNALLILIPPGTATNELENEITTHWSGTKSSQVLLGLLSYSQCISSKELRYCHGLESQEEHMVGSYLGEKKFIFQSIALQAALSVILDLSGAGELLDAGSTLLLAKAINPSIVTKEAADIAVEDFYQRVFLRAMAEDIETNGVDATQETFTAMLKKVATEEGEKLGDADLPLRVLENSNAEKKFFEAYEKTKNNTDTFWEGLKTAKNEFTDTVFDSLSTICPSTAKLDTIPFLSIAYAYNGCSMNVGRKTYEEIYGRRLDPSIPEEMYAIELIVQKGSKNIFIQNTSHREIFLYNKTNPSLSLWVQPGDTLLKPLNEFVDFMPCISETACLDFHRIMVHKYVSYLKIEEQATKNIFGMYTYTKGISVAQQALIRERFEIALYNLIYFLKNKAGFMDEFIEQVISELATTRRIVFDTSNLEKGADASASLYEISLKSSPSGYTSYTAYLDSVLGHELTHQAGWWRDPTEWDQIISIFKGRVSSDNPDVGNAAYEGFTELSHYFINTNYGFVKTNANIAYSPQVFAAEKIYKQVYSTLGQKEADQLIGYFTLGYWDQVTKILSRVYGMPPKDVWYNVLYSSFYKIPLK